MENKVREGQAFFLPMVPPTKTAQEKRWKCVKGKPVGYMPEELKAAYVKIRDAAAAYKPEVRWDGPLMLLVQWCFPADEKHPRGSWRTSKPDTDNLQKMLKDALTEAGFWVDDCLVVNETVQKFYLDTPGIYVRIERCEEDDL